MKKLLISIVLLLISNLFIYYKAKAQEEYLQIISPRDGDVVCVQTKVVITIKGYFTKAPAIKLEISNRENPDFNNSSHWDNVSFNNTTIPLNTEFIYTYEYEIQTKYANMNLYLKVTKYESIFSKPFYASTIIRVEEKPAIYPARRFDDNPLSTRQPLILIHGIGLSFMNIYSDLPSDKMWDNILQYLKDNGSFKYFKPYYFMYDSNDTDSSIPKDIYCGVSNVAICLRDRIIENNFNNIAIIAHSMGGLVSREFMISTKINNIDSGEKVSKLITLFTPHRGSPLPNFPPSQLICNRKDGKESVFLNDISWDYSYKSGLPNEDIISSLRWKWPYNLFIDYPIYSENKLLTKINNINKFNNKIYAYAGFNKEINFIADAYVLYDHWSAINEGVNNKFLDTSYSPPIDDFKSNDGVVPALSAYGDGLSFNIRYAYGCNHTCDHIKCGGYILGNIKVDLEFGVKPVNTNLTSPILIDPNPKTPVSNLTPILKWNAVLYATEYRLQITDQSTFFTTNEGRYCNNCIHSPTDYLFNSPTTQFQVPVGLLQNGKTYRWRVICSNSVQNLRSPWSSEHTFTTPASTTPPPPVNPTFEITSPVENESIIAGTQKTISWTLTPSQTSGEVNLYYVVGSNAPVKINTAPIAVSTTSYSNFIVPSLSGQSMQLIITYINASTSQSCSHVHTINITSQPVPPPPTSGPKLLTPTFDLYNVSLNPTLTWEAVTNAISYSYQLTTNPNIDSSIPSNDAYGTSIYISSTLQKNTTYYWRVRANFTGNTSSQPSTTYKFTTLGDPPPPPPPAPLQILSMEQYNSSNNLVPFGGQVYDSGLRFRIITNKPIISVKWYLEQLVNGSWRNPTWSMPMFSSGTFGTPKPTDFYIDTLGQTKIPPGAYRWSVDLTADDNTTTGIIQANYNGQDPDFIGKETKISLVLPVSFIPPNNDTNNMQYTTFVSNPGSQVKIDFIQSVDGNPVSTYYEALFSSVNDPPATFVGSERGYTGSNGKPSNPITVQLPSKPDLYKIIIRNSSYGAVGLIIDTLNSSVSKVSKLEIVEGSTLDIPINSPRQLTAKAYDSLNNPITDVIFNWQASCGSLSANTGQTVVYTSPSSPGDCAVTVTVGSISTLCTIKTTLPKLPSAPQNIRCIPTYTDITVQWDKPADIGTGINLRYKVYRGTDNINLSLLQETTSLSYKDSSANQNTVYYYSVSAITDSNNEGPKSQIFQTFIPVIDKTGYPSAPSLSVKLDNGYALLNWTQPGTGLPLTGFKIYRGTSAGIYDKTFGPYSPTMLIMRDTTVIKGQTYFFTVTAINQKGESDKSNEVSLTINSTQTTVSPILLSPSDKGINIQVPTTLCWEYMNGVHTYTVEVSTSPVDFTFSKIAASTTINTNVTFGNFLPNMTYYWRVQAKLLSGLPTAWSSVWSFTTANTTNPPDQVPIQISPANDDINVKIPVNIVWAPIQNVKCVNLVISTSNTDFDISAVSKANVYIGTSIVIQGLQTNTTYYWKINATKNDDTQTEWSPIWMFKTSTVVTGSIPSIPILTGRLNGTSVSLAWSKPVGTVAGYYLYRGTESGNYTIKWNLPYTWQSAPDSSTQKGITYYYAISAYNSYGESAKSSECVITIPNTGYTRPDAPIATGSLLMGKPKISWEKPTNNGGALIVGFYVYRGDKPGVYNMKWGTYSNATTWMRDVTAIAGKTYYYAVAAVNAAGESVKSNEVTVSVPITNSAFIKKCPEISILRYNIFRYQLKPSEVIAI